jgi:poly-gamma-glutamate synthesis protein (capsule biosynthesis protein)
MKRKPGRSVTFGAVGDIGFYGETARQMQALGGQWPFEKMRPHLQRADLLFGNMEAVVIPDDFPKEKIDPAGLISPLPGPQCAQALKDAGFDFLNLAANHVLDAGAIGLDHTKKCLEAAGLVAAGVGYTQREARKLAVVESGGITFGFLCYCEDNNYTLGHTEPSHAYYELETILADVEKHKREVDVLVVSIHGDIEFMPTPSVPRLRNSRQIARAGAKIILEHHPHVPQGIEMVNGALIAYSLGNFVFEAHTSNYMKGNGPHTAHSFLLLAKVSAKGVESFERVPFDIKEPPEQRPWPLEGKALADMQSYLSQLDALLQDEAFVRKTWREVAIRHLGIYIKRAGERIEQNGIENVLEDLIGRLCLVAENRSWMEEILQIGREQWQGQQKLRDPHHRPQFHFVERLKETAKKNPNA